MLGIVLLRERSTDYQSEETIQVSEELLLGLCEEKESLIFFIYFNTPCLSAKKKNKKKRI